MKKRHQTVVDHMKQASQSVRMPRMPILSEMEREMRRTLNALVTRYEELYELPAHHPSVCTANGLQRHERELDELTVAIKLTREGIRKANQWEGAHDKWYS